MLKQLVLLVLLQVIYSTAEYIAYEHLGCYASWGVKSYMQRVLRRGDEKDAILRCYEIAREKDYKIFAITDGNQCRSSRDAHHHLKYFRKASGCDNKGLGGHGRADLYKIEGGRSCESMPDGEYQDSQFCNSFVTCNNKKLFRQVCPQGLLFKASTRQCEAGRKCPGGYHGDGNSCKPSEMVLNVPCPRGKPCRYAPDGEHAHPESCRRYVVCHQQVAFEMVCPGALWFNRVTRQCDSPKNAKCAMDPCAQSNNPCQNGGKCTRLSDPDKTYKCECSSEYEGDYCEKHVPHPCKVKPCKNGGTCKELQGNKFQCTCTIGYKGDTCDEYSGRGLEKSSIIGKNREYVRTLDGWLRRTPHGHGHTHWVRCYEAVHDGWKSQTFHHNCDNRGATVVIVKSKVGGNEYYFGGYNNLGWNGNLGNYQRDTHGFLFSLKNKYHLRPFIMKQYQHPQHCYYNNNGYGPTFGGGHDLYIANDAGHNHNSYTNLGHTYLPPGGFSYNHQNTKQLLAGVYNFNPINYEVFYAVHKH